MQRGSSQGGNPLASNFCRRIRSPIKREKERLWLGKKGTGEGNKRNTRLYFRGLSLGLWGKESVLGLGKDIEWLR